MAKVLVYDFLYGPDEPDWPHQCRISLYLDGLLLTAECYDPIDNINRAVPHIVDVNDLANTPGGVTDAEVGTVIYHTCQGGTFVQVKLRLIAPFGTVQTEPNSPSCVIVPCETIDETVLLSHESTAGARDGQINAHVTYTQAGTVEYSIVPGLWQSSGTFIDLLPGTYMLRTRIAETGCSKSFLVVINAGVVPVTPPEFPWQHKYCVWFKLVRNGIEYPISEPVKWDQVTIVGKRDKDWHGWLHQYSDGQIDLEFDCPAGMEILQAEYDDNGGDGDVQFKYGYTYKGVSRTLFDSQVNFNTYKRLNGRVSATLEKSTLNAKFVSRFDTKVSMNESKSVDDVDYSPPASVKTTLHPKEILRQFVCRPEQEFTVADEIVLGTDFFIFPDTSAATLDEITKSYTKSIGSSALLPAENDNYAIELDFDTTLNGAIRFKLDFDFVAALQVHGLGGAAAIRINYQLCYNINGAEVSLGPMFTEDLYAHWFDPSRSVAQLHFAGVLSNVKLKRGDKFYYYVRCYTTNGFDKTFNLRQYDTDISYDSLELSPESPASGWFVHEVIEACMRNITDAACTLKSAFFGRQSYLYPTNGQGALNWLTNGKQIRNFSVADNPLSVSLKEVLTSLKAIYNIGFGFEKANVLTPPSLRVEPAKYFYQDKQILVIDNCSEYREESAAKDLQPNEIEIGYDKYQDSGYNTLDEFNTKHQYVGPIKTNKLKWSIVSSMIASGFKIEDVRRQQFLETSKDSYSNDEDCFIISMRRVTSDRWIPEKNEAFSKVENLLSPETAYNLRLSPKRMLYNQAEWILNALHYKLPTDKVKNRQALQNGKMVTQLDPTDDRPGGDINRIELGEGDDVVLSDYVAERIWRPEWIYFKARITPDKMDQINRALQGQDSTSTNYGYLTIQDENSQYQGGYPFELEYNFVTEQISGKLLKKWNSPVDPNAVCCAPLAINGCILKINGNDLIVQ